MDIRDELLEKAQLLLNVDDEEVLEIYVDQAIQEAANFTHNDDIESYSASILNMVIYKYQKRGSEALASESFGGVSLGYLDDYPETILKELRAKRKALLI